ncbi:hypothetical protein CPC08DRAFT_794389 [Agrocybe pediades]|nr:hypothetical protein CPC08DRAFT_794389 [Agrocybe pediades]
MQLQRASVPNAEQPISAANSPESPPSAGLTPAVDQEMLDINDPFLQSPPSANLPEPDQPDIVDVNYSWNFSGFVAPPPDSLIKPPPCPFGRSYFAITIGQKVGIFTAASIGSVPLGTFSQVFCTSFYEWEDALSFYRDQYSKGLVQISNNLKPLAPPFQPPSNAQPPGQHAPISPSMAPPSHISTFLASRESRRVPHLQASRGRREDAARDSVLPKLAGTSRVNQRSAQSQNPAATRVVKRLKTKIRVCDHSVGEACNCLNYDDAVDIILGMPAPANGKDPSSTKRRSESSDTFEDKADGQKEAHPSSKTSELLEASRIPLPSTPVTPTNKRRRLPSPVASTSYCTPEAELESQLDKDAASIHRFLEIEKYMREREQPAVAPPSPSRDSPPAQRLPHSPNISRGSSIEPATPTTESSSTSEKESDDEFPGFPKYDYPTLDDIYAELDKDPSYRSI